MGLGSGAPSPALRGREHEAKGEGRRAKGRKNDPIDIGCYELELSGLGPFSIPASIRVGPLNPLIFTEGNRTNRKYQFLYPLHAASDIDRITPPLTGTATDSPKLKEPRTRHALAIEYRSVMSGSIETLTSEALQLPPDQRLTLAHRILSSVEPMASAEIDAAWDTEIRERIARYDAGTVRSIPAPEVFSEIDRRLRR